MAVVGLPVLLVRELPRRLPAACNRNHPLFQHAQLLLQCLKIFTIAGSKLIQLQRTLSKFACSEVCALLSRYFVHHPLETAPDGGSLCFTVGGKLRLRHHRLRTETPGNSLAVFCFRA